MTTRKREGRTPKNYQISGVILKVVRFKCSFSKKQSWILHNRFEKFRISYGVARVGEWNGGAWDRCAKGERQRRPRHQTEIVNGAHPGAGAR